MFNNPFEIIPDTPEESALRASAVSSAKPTKIKTALVVDTNILLKKIHLKDLLRLDLATFEQNYEVFTLD